MKCPKCGEKMLYRGLKTVPGSEIREKWKCLCGYKEEKVAYSAPSDPHNAGDVTVLGKGEIGGGPNE